MVAESITTAEKADKTTIEKIIIIGSPIGDLSLKAESTTASRLGLNAMETPASIHIFI